MLDTPGIAITAALISVAVTLAATWGREKIREWARRRRIASAIVCELRVYRRFVGQLLTATKQQGVIQSQEVSQKLFLALIGELADLGPEPFLAVRSAYSYFGQLDFLRARFMARHSIPPQDQMNSAAAYVRTCEGSLEAIDRALAALRRFASRKAYNAALPVLRLTPMEEELLGGCGE